MICKFMQFMQMRSPGKMNFVFNVCIFLFLNFTVALSNEGNCSLKTLDGRSVSLKPLDWVWPVSAEVSKGKRIMYEISLCRPLDNQRKDSNCTNSSVCKIETDHNISLATFSGGIYQSHLKYSINWVMIEGPPCLTGTQKNHQVVINFQCGPNIGSPDLFFSSECVTHFNWPTSVICDKQVERKEVPCYVYDKDKKNKHDLQPLTKFSGAYRVTGNSTDALFINVCSDIITDSSLDVADCPKGAACLERDGKFYSVGQLKSGLTYSRLNKLIQITYETEGNSYPPGCTQAPKTKIIFFCPSRRNLMNGPELVAHGNCQFEIIWEVIYACPEESFSGDMKTCKFTNGYHNLEYDLSPLRAANGKVPYNITAEVNKKMVQFYLNICGGLGEDFHCGKKGAWQSTSACMKSSHGSSEVIGLLKDASLHYVDGIISLVYTGRDGCNRTNASWRTIINFECNRTVGTGYPVFVGKGDCIYYFTWKTVHACPKQYSNHTCSISKGNVDIDLQALHHEQGWNVIDGTVASINKRQILLNICGSLKGTGAAATCPSGSALCIRNKKTGNAISLGRYTTLDYDDKIGAVVVNYTSGDSCDNNKYITSQVRLFCQLGSTASNPVLVKESTCYYEFEWYTEAACPKSEFQGKDCKISKNDLGMQLDLSPLMSREPYKVAIRDYVFFLNVCAPVKGTDCNTSKNVSNIGGCAKKTSHPQEVFSIGESSSEIIYKNGVLSLEYTRTKNYSSSNNATRKTKIIFFCNPSAGKGNPIFMDQFSDWYMFIWYTSYACLRKTFVDCMAVDSWSGYQYDLSSLSQMSGREPWSTVDIDGKRKFYLNVCRPLTAQPYCSDKAAICAVSTENGTEQESIPNLGQALSSPTIQSDGHLALTYTFGEECSYYGEKNHYSATIHFVCSHRNKEESIHFLDTYGPCNYSFLWSTAAACALDKEESQDICSITDSVSGHTYNLKSLNLVNNYYNVTGVRKFRLNICGPVGNDGCVSQSGKENVSLCEIMENGETRIVGFIANYTLYASQDTPIRLSYKNGSAGEDASTVEISFECADNVSDVNFIEQLGNKYYFNMTSPLACKYHPTYCSATGAKGDRYDLTSLAEMPFRATVDTRPQMTSHHYQISLCSPLDFSPPSACHGAGACQLSVASNDAISLGYQQQVPRVVNDGDIIIQYSNGSDCFEKKGIKNSAEVKLRCSYKEKELDFLGVESCHYKFQLETPVACPIQEYTGSNCVVTNLLTNDVFDLSPMKKSESNYRVKHGEYIYLINVCEEILTNISECKGVGACQTKSADAKFAVNAGMPSHELSYKDGLITLTYNNGKGNCHKKYTRSTKITFMCDYNTDGLEEGPIFINEEDDCTYGFLWQTAYACPPYQTVNCTTVDDKGQTYELDTLALLSSNYYVRDSQNPNRTFAINVCRTLYPQANFRCSSPSSSAACVLEKNSTYDRKPYLAMSIGTKLSPPKIIDGHLTLIYTHGEKCNLVGRGDFFETVIEFRCDMKEKFTTPEFIKQDGCKFYFLWETSAACPIIKKEVVSNNCTVTNLQTGQVFNFTSLATNKPVKMKISSTQDFFLNICESIPNALCGNGVGACRQDKGKKVRAGNANSLLHYEDGVFLLNYTDGDKCNGGLSDRNTLITIKCSLPEDSGPRFISQINDCTYNIFWYTPLACENELPCVVEKDGVTVDLSVLANRDVANTFHSIDLSSTFFLNVCRPLKSDIQNLCTPSSAICKVNFGSSSGLNLGSLWKKPYLNEQDKITLDYKGGSVCSKNSSKRISSRIVFLCDYTAGIGMASIIGLSDDECEYVFEWRTSAACTSEILPKIPSQHCIFEDKEKGFSIDFSRLWRDEKPFEVTSGSKKYLINVCGGTKTDGLCQNSSFCSIEQDKEINYGSYDLTLAFHGAHFTLTSESLDVCAYNASVKRKSEIYFSCDASAGIGSPALYQEYPCSLVFIWKTSVACLQSLPKCTHFDGQHFYDLRMFSSISHSWSTKDAEDNTYWLNICNEIQREVVHDENHYCPSGSAICKVGKDRKGISIGTAASQKLNGNATDGLFLEYSNGEEFCLLSNGSLSLVSTIIRLICSKSTIENPEFVSGPEKDCTYNFQWKTLGACPKTEDEELVEENGYVFDKNFPQEKMNLAKHIYSTYIANEVHRDKYVYLFNLGGGVKSNDNSSKCYRAGVCQTKQSSDFFRDLGSISTRHFLYQGSELKLVLTSHGRPCGKNKNKNVTTTISFHCSPDAGVGNPEFFMESNNCDYLFNWKTSAVCSPVIVKGTDFKMTKTLTHESSVSVSTGVVVGIVLSLLLIVAIIAVFAKEERRSSALYKMKNCFRRVKLPRYRYVQSSNVDGDAVLLSPDEPLQRFHEESDVDIHT